MEFPEIGINLQHILHNLESVIERYVQTSPHLLADFLEGAFASLDLVVEDLAAFSTAAMAIEEDVAGVLHEDCAIEVCNEQLAIYC
jgi:hypothetical protein